MPTSSLGKRKRDGPHPYLSGNFAPVHQLLPLSPCSYSGFIPEEFHGGEYVRNGGSPVTNEDLGRDAHWFDGDGMLSGVAFRRTEKGVQPEFVNKYILTDVYLSSISSTFLRKPILPSIATLVNPLSSLLTITLSIFRAIFLVLLSHLPGSAQAIKRISVANTGVLFHDGRALATCESGPPMRISLPGLETIGWYNGKKAEGEGGGELGKGFGGAGPLSFMKEWTTAHPRVDPSTGELVLFHSTFAPPYVHYSIIPAAHPPALISSPWETPTRLLNTAIPGVSSAKMMHDFGVSLEHTVILDLPLSLDPFNLAKNLPVVTYDPRARSRFGVFPRYHPEQVRWFETNACCIFHTANTWDDKTLDKLTDNTRTQAVNMLACRMTSATLVYSAADLAAPIPIRTTISEEEEQCRLYYYQFSMEPAGARNRINHQFALSAISFEFPSLRDDKSMTEAQYIYGCSTSQGSFGAALGRAVKINCLVKINAQALIRQGKKDGWFGPKSGCVDERTIEEVLASLQRDDPIQIFKMPEGWYAQESRFIAKQNSEREDDGWIVFYAFDERQLDQNGECSPDAKSELWIVDARDMKTLVARIFLPMRVSYGELPRGICARNLLTVYLGLHGNFFPEHQVLSQRPVETVRAASNLQQPQAGTGIWAAMRCWLEYLAG